MPPTPCTGNTSKESSIFNTRFRKFVAPKHTTPAVRPISSAPAGPTKPEAGVMVPKPATIPVTIPNTLGLPYLIHSITIQAIAPAEAEIWVTIIAIPASPFAPKALPALKPNQPTQSIPAPVTVMVRLWGGIADCGKP